MLRLFLFLLLVAGTAAARASEPINAPVSGASATVTQPHVTAELIPETTTVEPGKPFGVALHLHMDTGWHTYWINPGDAGLATTIDWTLPEGFTAGPIEWPTPEKHAMGPLVTYGYEGDVYLLTTITPPKSDLPRHFDVKAHAEWLVCQEECIPGKADLTLPLDSGMLNLRLPIENTDFFAQARERLPVANTRWEVKGAYGAGPGLVPKSLWTQFKNKSGAASDPLGHLYFFPEQNSVLSVTQDNVSRPATDQKLSEFQLILPLEQNGDKPDKVSGVLVSDQPLIGDAKAVYIEPFPTDAKDVPMSSASLANPDAQPVGATTGAPEPGGGSASPSGGPDNLLSGSSRQGGTTGSDQTAAQRAAATEGTVAGPASATEDAAPAALLTVLGLAFIGGLILNLMPCVLPVLSLKVFSLMKHAGENPRAAWVQGAAFTAGVVVSFWVLAGLLIALRTAGHQLGWGFQMQSPGFVLALIFLFFLLGLNLFGVFELGSSLVGLDAKATGHLGGLASSFGNGALATVAATPCTAPFMGSALGFAAQQPPLVSLLIFTFLALGMAAPYLLLTIFPGALRFVPKPGAWMEAFKQFMGFLLMATVIFLIYVFGALVGEDVLPVLLFTLLLAGIGAWQYGRWGTVMHSPGVRGANIISAFCAIGLAVYFATTLAVLKPVPAISSENNALHSGSWQPWSQGAVDAALTKGQPVFVDFTAAWCLSCKVNEAVALGTGAVKQAFAEKNVALFRADWTHSDPDISKALQKFNRDGVPLYLLYSPKEKENPQVLPAVLTPGIVLEAVGNL
ncbi:MAG TPA: thioredoxin family protein [Candidatus Methylacidiphilales bacterium]|nr:thioredoxin family protein [Candidatus Methylacidiphilales bacterium]